MTLHSLQSHFPCITSSIFHICEPLGKEWLEAYSRATKMSSSSHKHIAGLSQIFFFHIVLIGVQAQLFILTLTQA